MPERGEEWGAPGDQFGGGCSAEATAQLGLKGTPCLHVPQVWSGREQESLPS